MSGDYKLLDIKTENSDDVTMFFLIKIAQLKLLYMIKCKLLYVNIN